VASGAQSSGTFGHAASRHVEQLERRGFPGWQREVHHQPAADRRVRPRPVERERNRLTAGTSVV
jgi:hypothetical protein